MCTLFDTIPPHSWMPLRGACRLLADRRCPRSLTKFSFAYGHNEVSLWTGHSLPRKRGISVRLLWPNPTFPRTMFSLRQACLYRDVDGWGKEAPQGSGIAILATIVGRLEARPLSCPVLGKDVGTTSVGSARGCGGVSNAAERHPLNGATCRLKSRRLQMRWL